MCLREPPGTSRPCSGTRLPDRAPAGSPVTLPTLRPERPHGLGGVWIPVLPPVRVCPGSAGTDTCRPARLPLRSLGPARGSGSTGASPGTLSPAPSALPHWLRRPVGVAAAGPARTGSARGVRTEAKALWVIFSLIGRAGPNGRGLRAQRRAIG